MQRRGRLAGNDFLPFASAKCIASEFFCGCTVGLSEKYGDTLNFRLVLEPTNIVFLRKLIRRPGFVSQQVPHCVVVLAVREAAHEHRLSFRFHHTRDRRLGAGRASEVPYPKLQEFLLLAARQDTLAPSVFQPIGRFGDQQRLFGILLIYQRNHPPAEGLNIFIRG
jgi:hypothetical protein